RKRFGVRLCSAALDAANWQLRVHTQLLMEATPRFYAQNSLIPQRLDGVELRSFARGVEAEENSHRGAENKGIEDPLRRNHGGPVLYCGQKFSPANPQADAEQAAAGAQRHGLDQELQQDVAPARADGHA